MYLWYHINSILTLRHFKNDNSGRNLGEHVNTHFFFINENTNSQCIFYSYNYHYHSGNHRPCNSSHIGTTSEGELWMEKVDTVTQVDTTNYRVSISYRSTSLRH